MDHLWHRQRRGRSGGVSGLGAEVSDWARLTRGDEPRLPAELAEALTLAQELKPEQTANLAAAFADLDRRVDRRDTERLRRESPTDRVVAYFEGILGRPLTRAEKIPIPAILAGDTEEML